MPDTTAALHEMVDAKILIPFGRGRSDPSPHGEHSTISRARHL